jgi:hypothetical protein
MRGEDEDTGKMFSYVSAERRIPADHPLRAMRQMVDAVLKEMSPRFDGLYAKVGRPSIAPEKLLRALLIQILYSVRSERLLMEQLDYNLLFRWFVGLEMDDPVWDATVTVLAPDQRQRDRRLTCDVGERGEARKVLHAFGRLMRVRRVEVEPPERGRRSGHGRREPDVVALEEWRCLARKALQIVNREQEIRGPALGVEAEHLPRMALELPRLRRPPGAPGPVPDHPRHHGNPDCGEVLAEALGRN